MRDFAQASGETSPQLTEVTVQWSFDPVGWQQLELLARLTPAQRTLAMIRAAAFVRAGLRGTFRRRFPALSDEEINMKVLAYLSPLRGYTP